MENAEEIFQSLDDFSKRKPKVIPRELEEYLSHVARTGDPVYQWPLVKCLFKEKLINVITDFYETSPGLDIPHCPNVDPFNYDTLKNSLIEKIEAFSSAPFTVQRICELLTAPRKQYNRIDKFMRAIEKNVLVVSTREPGAQRHVEHENGDVIEPMVNGSDNNSDYNVDVEMDDLSWKDQQENQRLEREAQPGSSEVKDTADDIPRISLEAVEEKTQYESVTPPEMNISVDDTTPNKNDDSLGTDSPMAEDEKTEAIKEDIPQDETTRFSLFDVIEKNQQPTPMIIPEIIIQNAEQTEKLIEKVSEEAAKPEAEEVVSTTKSEKPAEEVVKKADPVPVENEPPCQTIEMERRISIESERETDSNDSKHIAEVLTSSEESSSSSDNTDGNSNSPRMHNEATIDTPEESNQSTLSDDAKPETVSEDANIELIETTDTNTTDSESEPLTLKTDDYTIADVKSELPQPTEIPKVEEPTAVIENAEIDSAEIENAEIDSAEIKNAEIDSAEIKSTDAVPEKTEDEIKENLSETT